MPVTVNISLTDEDDHCISMAWKLWKQIIIILSYPMLRYERQNSAVGQNYVERDLFAKENNIVLNDKRHAIV